uniref:hypothetical protein n=1 Tax=unclassified Variovorax TaxID=663243 RepID=UPI00104D87E1
MTFLNSTFATTVVGSLVGALAGAWGGATAAQSIAEKSKTREMQLSQLRQTHSALMTSFVICNAALGFKTQNVRRLHQNFIQTRAQFVEFMRRREAHEIDLNESFSLRADLVTLNVPPMPAAALFTQVNERLSVSRRPLALSTAIAGAIESLTEAVELRNRLVEQFRADDHGPASSINPFAYLGLERNGRQDRVYADTMDSIARLCDDTIYFSALLCEDLASYGNSILARADKVVKEAYPSVGRPDFSDARAKGNMPNDTDYVSFLAAFPAEKKVPDASKPELEA